MPAEIPTTRADGFYWITRKPGSWCAGIPQVAKPTEEFFMCGDVMVRMWQGNTEAGQPVVVLVAGVSGGDQGFELAQTLVSIPPPDEKAAKRWAEEVFRRADKGGE